MASQAYKGGRLSKKCVICGLPTSNEIDSDTYWRDVTISALPLCTKECVMVYISQCFNVVEEPNPMYH